MFLPSDFDKTLRYPLIDYIYPGPQIAHQPQWFQTVGAAPARALAEVGFITVMLDTRGTPTGSRSFHQVGYPSLLEPQLADHAAVMRQLQQRYPFIAPERTGILGHSAGGAAAARALLDYGDTFKVGVAVCGNHDPGLYAAAWSDKYRGSGDRALWKDHANGTVAHKLRGKLLLVSGDMDENVHVSQTLCLVDALIQANREFDLLIVPNEGHLVMMTSGYVQRRIWDYFVQHLMEGVPPSNFEISFTAYEQAQVALCLWQELRR